MPLDLTLKGKISPVMQHKIKYCMKGQLHLRGIGKTIEARFFLFHLGSPKVVRISLTNLVPSKSNTKLGNTEKVISVILSMLC